MGRKCLVDMLCWMIDKQRTSEAIAQTREEIIDYLAGTAVSERAVAARCGVGLRDGAALDCRQKDVAVLNLGEDQE